MGLIQVAHAYDIELYAAKKERAAKVRIGSDAASVGNKFVPNINMSKWDDEHWININFPIAIANQVETFDGEKVTLSIGDYSFIYYPKNEDDLEFEIVFGKKPPVMTLSLDILSSGGLDFLPQPALTQSEIDDHHVRPDNVVGSYAVYCRSRDNKYCTGKFCHIYYPYLQDADGKTVRVESFDISAGKMTIVLPPKWMESARYPVSLDPTIGNTTAGGSSWATTAGKEAWGISDATGGVIGKYHISIATSAGNAKMGVYPCTVTGDITGGGLGAALLEQSGGFAIAIQNDNQANSPGGTIAANTRYAVVSFTSNASPAVKYDVGAANDGWYLGGPTYANECINPSSDSWSTGTSLYSQWIDYAAAGGTNVSKYKKYYDYRRAQ